MNNNATHTTTSYHNSKAKRANRAFKFIHAKRAIRRCGKTARPGNIATLCGNSVAFESAIVEYSIKQGIECEVHSYNKKSKEIVGAFQQRATLPEAIASRISINAQSFSHWNLTEGTVFVDFDTCSWFPTVADETIKLCGLSYMVAVTILIDGVRDFWLDGGFDNLSAAQCKDPAQVAQYLEKMTGALCVGIHTYNNPSGVHKMATIILENTTKKTALRVRECFTEKKPKKKRNRSKYRDNIRAMLIAGNPIESVAAEFGASLRTVGAIKAWLHPSFDRFRKNF